MWSEKQRRSAKSDVPKLFQLQREAFWEQFTVRLLIV